MECIVHAVAKSRTRLNDSQKCNRDTKGTDALGRMVLITCWMQSCHQPSICGKKKKKKAISAKYSQRNTAGVFLYAENAWILFLNIIDAELIYNVALFLLYSKVIQL